MYTLLFNFTYFFTKFWIDCTVKERNIRQIIMKTLANKQVGLYEVPIYNLKYQNKYTYV